MRSEIIKIHKEIDATTIYVTHDQTESNDDGLTHCDTKSGEFNKLARQKKSTVISE